MRFNEPIPFRARRILIAGTTGVGKTTFARRLSLAWGVPYTELDALHHGPGWVPRPTFEDDVRELADHDAWITEWQYWGRGMGPVLGDRAELLVWLDFPRWIAWPRLLRRTIRRRVRREVRWNGNVEPPLRTIFTDENHILRWEWKTHTKWRERIPLVPASYPHLLIVRLRSPREARRWAEATSLQRNRH